MLCSFRSMSVAAAAALFATAVGCESTAPSTASAEAEEDFTVATSCGGFAGLTCTGSKICVDDPSDWCDPASGGADCQGLCVTPSKVKTCGGITGKQCASGYACVDDPRDTCVPGKGGADCGGLCVQAPCSIKLAVTVTCAKGTAFDLGKCACIPTCDSNKIKTTTCASGSHFDTMTCACVKTCDVNPITVTCAKGKHFDAKLCACVN